MTVKKPTQQEIDSTKNWSIWTKEVSEFPWEYEMQETCYILEGEVEVIAEGGEKINFSAGDWVVFEKGLKCSWKITKAVKKRYNFD